MQETIKTCISFKDGVSHKVNISIYITNDGEYYFDKEKAKKHENTQRVRKNLKLRLKHKQVLCNALCSSYVFELDYELGDVRKLNALFRMLCHIHPYLRSHPECINQLKPGINTIKVEHKVSKDNWSKNKYVINGYMR